MIEFIINLSTWLDVVVSVAVTLAVLGFAGSFIKKLASRTLSTASPKLNS